MIHDQIFLILAIFLALSTCLKFNSPKFRRVSPLRLTSMPLLPSKLIVRTTPLKNVPEGLKIKTLPKTDLNVSEICLGTMNFGLQVEENEAFKILDCAFSEIGINFLDTCETYPYPMLETHTFETSRLLGKWLKTKRRSDVIISSMVAGNNEDITWLRRKNNSPLRATREQIIESVDAQLSRLGTDYIDLLQINWPDRYVPTMEVDYVYEYEMENHQAISITEQLEAIQILIKAGKVRHYGVANETPYGIASWAHFAEKIGMPGPSTTQNEYNLLCRNEFEPFMNEACSPINANVGLLAYSPLAGGALTGKYGKGEVAISSARLHKYMGFMYKYIKPSCLQAIEDYSTVAADFEIPLAIIALGFVYSRKFVSSTIIGVSSVDQLQENLLGLNVPCTDELEEEINNIYERHRDPAKGVLIIPDIEGPPERVPKEHFSARAPNDLMVYPDEEEEYDDDDDEITMTDVVENL